MIFIIFNIIVTTFIISNISFYVVPYVLVIFITAFQLSE